ELGADDYVVKPFSPREVVSRIKAILRRSEPRPVSASTRAPRALVIDEECRTVTYFGEKLSLPRYEFDIVRLLAARPGRVFSRDRIMEQVWTDPGESFDRTVDAHIKSIRAKLRAVRPDLD
ncbi:winged helix-turn-helix domain-containing protein, partial [Arthrospira platensis SPKY1]|nr:winged helix-turn-helix domain-containing protein [Arthrospira platensis SPKY1]